MSALAPAMRRPACCWCRAPKRALCTPSVPRPGMPPYKVGGAQPAIQERRQRRVADMQTLYMMAAMARGRLPPSLLSNKVMRTWSQAAGSRPVLMHRCHKSAAASLKRGGSRSSSVARHWSKPAAVRAALCRAAPISAAVSSRAQGVAAERTWAQRAATGSNGTGGADQRACHSAACSAATSAGWRGSPGGCDGPVALIHWANRGRSSCTAAFQAARRWDAHCSAVWSAKAKRATNHFGCDRILQERAKRKKERTLCDICMDAGNRFGLVTLQAPWLFQLWAWKVIVPEKQPRRSEFSSWQGLGLWHKRLCDII